ncbi:single cache domain-containing protein [Ancylobacter aquaticus]|uniref:Single cache domain-containing protein n=1 Tax=Ancylobacter aquaticus TaxID=100 RepID=A0A4R1I3C5_ANCAQ|nr:cache domain-containing protein [Ancylobacter aquaticus]TCK28125.1 single cache domain-containing protein [Ancylobacter aquaticus]
MFRTSFPAIMLSFALLGAHGTMAKASGTADEARSMLERAVIAVKADQARALAAFNAGLDGFRDRDLYVFCNKLDGVTVAHARPGMLGANLNDEKDPSGKEFGKEMLSHAREGEVHAVSYAVPRPGGGQPVPKESYVTRIGDLVCGVGYYK